MKISREPLLRALLAAQPACAARSTKPILANVLIDDAEIHATDLEIGIRVTMPATGLTACVPPDKLIAILRECGGDEIDAVLNADTLTIRTASGRFNLPTADPAEFPKVTAEDGVYITVPDLAAKLKLVTFAADKRESGARWAVTGTLFDTSAGKLSLCATDTKRLALLETGIEFEKSPAAIVPQKATAILERIAGPVGIRLEKQQAVFLSDDSLIVSRLVEGRFPPYDSILPKKTTIALSLDREPLLSAVKQAAILMDADSARMEFAFADGKLTLTASGAESGQSEVTLNIGCDHDITIAFDPQYVVQFLRACEEATVELRMTSAEKPAVFAGGEGYRYLVMPLAG